MCSEFQNTFETQLVEIVGENLISIRYLLCARYCVKYIAYVNVFNFCSNPMILVVLREVVVV